MIDIEEELKTAQIKHIQKELEQLQLYYNDIADLKFLQILCSYKEMLELTTTTDERPLHGTPFLKPIPTFSTQKNNYFVG